MSNAPTTKPNVKQAIPFFGVSDIDKSVRYYTDGNGVELKHRWMPEGKLRWCWLQIGDAAVMLHELAPEEAPGNRPIQTLGEDVSICFQCEDVLAMF